MFNLVCCFPGATGDKLVHRKECYRQGKDIIIPPNEPRAHEWAKQFFYQQYPHLTTVSKPVTRSTLLFFAGTLSSVTNYRYSFNVRQQIYRHYGKRPGFWLVEGKVPDYVYALRSSYFCLAPAGWGWGESYRRHSNIPIL